MSKELLKRQDVNYKNGTTKSRSVKLFVPNFTKEDFEKFLPIQRQISKMLFKSNKSKKLDFNSKSLADHIFPEYVKELVDKFGFSQTFVKRCLIRPIIKRYASYEKRHKGKIRTHPISVKNKSFHLYDGCVELDKINEIIKFKPYPADNNNNMISEYNYLGTMGKYEEFLSNSPGGNLIFTKKGTIYTIRAKIPFTWKYQPEDFVAYDCNKSDSDFLKFSKPIILFGEEGNVIKKTHISLKRALSLERQLKELNNEDKNNTIRNKIIIKHKHHEKEYSVLVNEILDYVEDNELCLCIDDLATGNKNGSFGQDKAKELLIKEGENRRVPFVIVPTPYTTRICHKCDYMHDTIPLSVRKFNCQGCNAELIRDENAALVIAARGKAIWELGLAQVKEDFKAKYGKSMVKN